MEVRLAEEGKLKKALAQMAGTHAAIMLALHAKIERGEMDVDGLVPAALRWIAAYCKRSPSRVGYAVKEMETLGYLKIEKGHGRNSRYRIAPHLMPSLPSVDKPVGDDAAESPVDRTQSPVGRTDREERESESMLSTESTAARVRGKKSTRPVPLARGARPLQAEMLFPIPGGVQAERMREAPRDPASIKRARHGWIGWLTEYLRECEPGELGRFWEMSTVRDDESAPKEAMQAAREYLNALTDRARASEWYRDRQARVRDQPHRARRR